MAQAAIVAAWAAFQEIRIIMTADIVNLKQARKANTRADRSREADENRAKFGRSKADRQKSAVEKILAARKLDALKREK